MYIINLFSMSTYNLNFQVADAEIPRDFRTIPFAILSNLSRSSRHIFEASTFAPLSSFGSEKKNKKIKNYVKNGELW